MGRTFGDPTVKSEKYQNVYRVGQGNKIKYRAQISIDGELYHATFTEEKDAAKKVDLWLIQRGKKPVNIYKKKEE